MTSARLFIALILCSATCSAQAPPTGRPELVLRTGQVGPVGLLAFSPDAKLLASTSRSERNIKLWDAASGSELRTLAGHQGQITALFFNSAGTSLISTDGESLVVWDVSDGRQKRAFGDLGGGAQLQPVSKAGSMLLLHSRTRERVRLLNIDTGADQPLASPLGVITVSPSGRFAAVVSTQIGQSGKLLPRITFDGSINLIDLSTGSTVRAIQIAHESSIGAKSVQLYRAMPSLMAFSADGRLLAAAVMHINMHGGLAAMFNPSSESVSVDVWEVATGRKIRSVSRQFPAGMQKYGETNLLFSPDARSVALVACRGEFVSIT